MARLRFELGTVSGSTYSGRSTLRLLCWKKKRDGSMDQVDLDLEELTLFDLRMLVREIQHVLVKTEDGVRAVRQEMQ